MTEELDSFLKKRKRRNGVQLVLTPLIDIFTLLIIFIVKGTVFSQSDLILPKGVTVPESHSKESLDNTPKLLVFADRFQWGPAKEEYPIGIVRDEFALHPLRQQFVQRLKAYFDKESAGKAASPWTVQVIADKASRYETIFSVSQFLQAAGVARVVYVTSGAK